ncbi:alpha/beta hydrolase [Haloarchaeobius iranensis]|uniref:Pimeloyl-ACP methyl ester carboxylesterase n=1 Tax=Haloarchaeobius iranensis TaxID=996166 RepID=A0A1G9V2I1_9EURY|nr:alpha/beta hydrolase [Haloarchaeobius iranensis]SDM66303.1 Pimeloyl-ACP methyl ester carboxylesterase [Haloarchaeobius iranensis]
MSSSPDLQDAPPADAESAGARPAESGTTATATATTATTTDGRTVAYAEYGAADGTPVVFLHGTPGSHVLGRLFDDVARERDCRIVAPARPGYGDSDPAPDATVADIADDLVAVLDHAGVERAPVVGFSGGAAVAIALAGRHPNRVEAVHSVSGVAPPSLRTEQPAVQRLLETLATRTPRLLSGLVRGQSWVADRGSPSVVVSQYTDSEGAAALSEAQAETFRRDFVVGVGPQRTGFVTETRRFGHTWPVQPAELSVPLHCWHGDRDANVPVADARRVADAADGVLTVRDADHATALVECRAALLDACLE